jgi:hypothetical protein
MPMVKPATTSMAVADHDEEERRGRSQRSEQELDEAGDEDDHREAVIDERGGRRVGRLDQLGEQQEQREEDDRSPTSKRQTPPLSIGSSNSALFSTSVLPNTKTTAL